MREPLQGPTPMTHRGGLGACGSSSSTSCELQPSRTCCAARSRSCPSANFPIHWAVQLNGHPSLDRRNARADAAAAAMRSTLSWEEAWSITTRRWLIHQPHLAAGGPEKGP